MWHQSVKNQVKVAPKITLWHQKMVPQGSPYGSMLEGLLTLSTCYLRNKKIGATLTIFIYLYTN